jgi:uncharacterized membrane protein YgdD (TMEM256/DUF423 family)
MQGPRILTITACLGALGVALGAFGAHGLKQLLDAKELEWWDTGVRYLFYNLPGLGLCGLLARPDRQPKLAALALLAGTTIFSGSLFAMALTGVRWLGAITPIGGVLLIVGWLLLIPHCRHARA